MGSWSTGPRAGGRPRAVGSRGGSADCQTVGRNTHSVTSGQGSTAPAGGDQKLPTDTFRGLSGPSGTVCRCLGDGEGLGGPHVPDHVSWGGSRQKVG